ncbi:MAG: dual specificity protein phosphatase family protein [Dehalococcoidia bacterium]|jgi:atypical dual specificity phosphatase
MTGIVTPNYMNFSWLIDSELAGHRGIESTEQIQFLNEQGVKALVRMTQIPKVTTKSLEEAGFQDYHLSIPDMAAPTLADISHMIGFIYKCLGENKPVGVSCDGGYGRTGTLLSCFMVTRGMKPSDAIQFVKKKRPGTVLTYDQDRTVYSFADEYRRDGAINKCHKVL